MAANLPQWAKSATSPIDGPVHRLATSRVLKCLQNLNFLMWERKYSFVTRVSNFFPRILGTPFKPYVIVNYHYGTLKILSNLNFFDRIDGIAFHQ